MGFLAALFSGVQLAFSVVKTGVKGVWKVGKGVFKTARRYGRKATKRVGARLDAMEKENKRLQHNKNKHDNTDMKYF